MKTDSMQSGVEAADLSDVEVGTSTSDVTVGVSPDVLDEPQPELNGWRVKIPGEPALYLIDWGYRRLIPDSQTYDYIFRDTNGIQEDGRFSDIPLRPSPLSSGAVGAVLAVPAGMNACSADPASGRRQLTSPVPRFL